MSPCSRRKFLKLSASVVVSGLLPLPALAAVAHPTDRRRSLSLFNTHTREVLEAVYFKDGRYQPDALVSINTILRDHRTEEIKPIDLRLLDTLCVLRTRISTDQPFHIISGYRSPATNELLRKQTNGVARTSYHIQGRAVDIRLPGYGTHLLHDQCMRLNSGGVGYYPKSDFVHLDTGPARNW
jgi:uncharacterized protein YcbK (DUF882 family)